MQEGPRVKKNREGIKETHFATEKRLPGKGNIPDMHVKINKRHNTATRHAHKNTRKIVQPLFSLEKVMVAVCATVVIGTIGWYFVALTLGALAGIAVGIGVLATGTSNQSSTQTPKKRSARKPEEIPVEDPNKPSISQLIPNYQEQKNIDEEMLTKINQLNEKLGKVILEGQQNFDNNLLEKQHNFDKELLEQEEKLRHAFRF
ncbi:MAG TPA: hypothetical protein VFP93_01995 [Gammaproteobacteria bacterium]|nr:hypothetical protein [Gammaproteobacteria bacterium]